VLTTPLVIGLPFCCHWKVNGAVPAAVTVNVTVVPELTVWLAGCTEMIGTTWMTVMDAVALAVV